jgi:hypothetical protein
VRWIVLFASLTIGAVASMAIGQSTLVRTLMVALLAFPVLAGVVAAAWVMSRADADDLWFREQVVIAKREAKASRARR